MPSLYIMFPRAAGLLLDRMQHLILSFIGWVAVSAVF